MRVGRSSWSYLAFAAYAAVSLLMVNDPLLDVMRVRFLWISVTLGLAAAACARREVPA